MSNDRFAAWAILLLGCLGTTALYWPGLSGGYVFDDFPNIVHNSGLHATSWSVPELAKAALSSPSSDFKRPLSSLSLAFNHLVTGLDPYGMKLTNLVIHLLNGLLLFLLAERLLALAPQAAPARHRVVAAIVASAWLVLPINLTSVLYVVQRMESLANLFVIAGLLGYLHGRSLMSRRPDYGLTFSIASLVGGTALGVMAKETAALLPLYAFVIEHFALRGFAREAPHRRRLMLMYLCLLAIPLTLGLAWILPKILQPGAWSRRDFSLPERLLSESRIVLNYIAWTILPTPDTLSFYHDDFRISRGLTQPWSTLPSVIAVAGLVLLPFLLRRRAPMMALGLMLFLCAHTLTATILPLELIFEHRNYFASFGLMLVLVPTLLNPAAMPGSLLRRLRPALLGSLFLLWGGVTLMTANAWGNPLRLAVELAARAPTSIRAQYDLGKTYIVYSKYDADSPFVPLAYQALEAAASAQGGSILPEQALILLAARTDQPQKAEWWDRLIRKLAAARPSVEDDAALAALVRCANDGKCALPPQKMLEAFMAALSHPGKGPNLLASYGDYAWNALNDRALGEQLIREAVQARPREPAYRITLTRMLIVQGKIGEAEQQMHALAQLNTQGRLDRDLHQLGALLGR